MSLNFEERKAVVTYRVEKAAKTHEGIIRIFGLEYVKKGRVPVEMGKLYNKLFTLRLTGDYNDHYGLEEQNVLPLLQPTIDLIDTVSHLAEGILKESSD